MFSTIEQAIADIRRGRVLIVVDDENRENEGDFIGASSLITPEKINFMTKHGRGLICFLAPGSWLDRLNLPAMVSNNTAKLGTAFAISVDAVEGTTTGISAHDRAQTIKVLANPRSRPSDLARPGHIFPIRAVEGGVLRRAGHTEATVDLCRLAGLDPCGVLCEIMDSDGTMARLPRLKRLAERFDLRVITIADLIAYRRRKEKLIRRIVETVLPTKYGAFKLYVYESSPESEHHLALVKSDVAGHKNVLVRVHSQCLTGDVFGSQRCDCGSQLEAALRRISDEGCGVFVYMRQEGRGIGLLNKIRAYALQDKGLDTVDANLALGFPADLRDYGVGAQILADLGLSTIRLLTNNPKKIIGLEGYGLKVSKQLPLFIAPNRVNLRYLKAKRDRLGHIMPPLRLRPEKEKNKEVKNERLSRRACR